MQSNLFHAAAKSDALNALEHVALRRFASARFYGMRAIEMDRIAKAIDAGTHSDFAYRVDCRVLAYRRDDIS